MHIGVVRRLRGEQHGWSARVAFLFLAFRVCIFRIEPPRHAVFTTEVGTCCHWTHFLDASIVDADSGFRSLGLVIVAG